MILINKNTNFENLSFEEAKKDLQELYEYSSIFEELENNAFSEEDQNNDFIKAKLLISEIKEKQGLMTMKLVIEFIQKYPNIKGRKQIGEETFYKKRKWSKNYSKGTQSKS